MAALHSSCGSFVRRTCFESCSFCFCMILECFRRAGTEGIEEEAVLVPSIDRVAQGRPARTGQNQKCCARRTLSTAFSAKGQAPPDQTPRHEMRHPFSIKHVSRNKPAMKILFNRPTSNAHDKDAGLSSARSRVGEERCTVDIFCLIIFSLCLCFLYASQSASLAYASNRHWAHSGPALSETSTTYFCVPTSQCGRNKD